MERVLIYDAGREGWLHCERPVEIVVAYDRDEVLPALQHVESRAVELNAIAAGFISYEAAPAFDRALEVRTPDPSFPLLWFALFEPPLPQSLPSHTAGRLLRWEPDICLEDYNAAIGRIKDYIAEGDTYQVNFSFRLRSPFDGEAHDLFRQLIASQPSRHGAFIETDAFAICSASPELFFSLDGNTIASRPMKGTMPRGLTLGDDEANAAFLRSSEKNRAENVMIVDMMRNDLGRIAETGSVNVPSLFDVERYPTVWQMTSTVSARTDASIAEIIRAVFPCASVTGAPKARTMQIITELENSPRKIYTGAIGFIGPQRRAQFNVAIRTVLVDKRKKVAEYGVGGGIVWGSTSKGEYEECLTKARVLADVRPPFELLETILYTPSDGFFLLEEHLARLCNSCAYFGFRFDRDVIIGALNDAASRVAGEFVRVRLTVGENGRAEATAEPIGSIHGGDPVRIRLAESPVDSHNLFLYHKTTFRTVYDEALRSAPDCDDVLLWNERGEVTESTIANIVMEIDGMLYTPPVSSGLLAGTFRERLLRDGMIKERVITSDELTPAANILLINSLRKWRKAVLL